MHRSSPSSCGPRRGPSSGRDAGDGVILAPGTESGWPRRGVRGAVWVSLQPGCPLCAARTDGSCCAGSPPLPPPSDGGPGAAGREGGAGGGGSWQVSH